ncbi:ShKT domain-containing protein [Strongyloides ratti]|uniref:ShKT domain-containing protein n=1 Tax=Strongyloides ratti TaxID=34506 RepID=A0A090LCH8_STRRB|nr:ShKT domain-containing protein [Strongyloides ratti]CEF67477.1 ShKT domain-containing protein [Strongyloides ratti]
MSYIIKFVKSDANCDRPFTDLASGNCIGIELQDYELNPPVAANYLSCYWNGPWLCRTAERNNDPNNPNVLCCSNNVDGDEALSEVTYLYHRYTQNLAFTTTITPCYDVNKNCDTIGYLCREPTQFGYMFSRCKMTCGFCGDATAPPLCRDKPTVSCKRQAIYCNDPLYKDFLTQSCPRTCSRCGPSYTWKNVTTETPNISPSPHLCIDVRTNCPKLRASCSNIHVASSCPKTCGTCN